MEEKREESCASEISGEGKAHSGEDSASDPPDISLKDYEEKILKEMEHERRRIIQNQVVRRKKNFRWPFHFNQSQKEASSSLSLAGVFKNLRHYKQKKQASDKKLNFIDSKKETEAPTPPEPDQLEKEDESEEAPRQKMSDQDLITFAGEERREEGQDIPETETVPVEEAKPEDPDSLEPVNKDEEKPNMVSTAYIDFNVAEAPKNKEEEREEVSVEFEQLNLSSSRPEVTAPVIDTSRGLDGKEKKSSKRPPNNHAAESKIAMEIREMRKREEELRKMREKSTTPSKPQEIPNESIQSDGSTKSEDFLEDDGGSSNVSYHTKNSMTRAVSLDSLHVGQTYNIGYAFCHRRKDRIKVKPLEDGDEEREPSKYRALKESPIEREIRQAREREEELRKEKGLIRNGEEKEKKSKQIEPAKQSEIPATGNDTQRLLATSRIQQEIQEQTRREMALRESGHIQTISQERTDSKVTRIREAGNCQTDSVDRKQTPSPTVEIYEKTNGHAVNGKSPSSPTSSSSSANNIPVGRRLSNPPAPGRGISMQRFIKSKGKDLGFNAFSGSNYYADNSHSDYYEIRPPQVRKINGHLGSVVSRRSATAESKIQEELKEMKAREDELKRQRARLLGLSQPNLSSLVSDEDLMTNGDSEEGHLDRSNSNPNLLEDNDNHDSNVSNGRRRSALIAQWEQRIQKAEAKS